MSTMSVSSRRLLHTTRTTWARESNHYEVLGVSRTSSKREIKNKFYELSKKAHPDTGGDRAQFQKLTEAYSILGDDAKRRQYDISSQPNRTTSNPYGGPSTTYSPHSPYLRNQRARTGPHRAWANSSSSPYGQSSTQSRPQSPWNDYGFSERTGGAAGRRAAGPPPQFGSASHHHLRYPFNTGGRASSQAGGQGRDEEDGGEGVRKESGTGRFLGVLFLLMTVIGIGGGFNVKAEEKEREEGKEDECVRKERMGDEE